MKLISMTYFVLNINELVPKESDQFFQSWQNKKMMIIENYANFLNQPLKLEMFVTCDEDGNIVSKFYNGKIDNKNKTFSKLSDEYQQAKNKVLFEGFEIATNKEGEKVILGDYTCLKVSDLENGTIEDLVKYVHIKLTKSAVKRIFG